MTIYTDAIQRVEKKFLSILADVEKKHKENVEQLKREWTTKVAV